MKTEAELRAKLEEILKMDCTKEADAQIKAAIAKALLWALGENDDDRYYIHAKPGPPVLLYKRKYQKQLGTSSRKKDATGSSSKNLN